MKRSLQLVHSLSVFSFSLFGLGLATLNSIIIPPFKNIIDNILQVLTASKIVRKMKPKFTKAWISFLRLPLPIDVYKEVTTHLYFWLCIKSFHY